jgi:hypothetical protein
MSLLILLALTGVGCHLLISITFLTPRSGIRMINL